MKCENARERIQTGEFWLQKIFDNYHLPTKDVEYFTESFLITCRTVTDYVVRDLLEGLEPKLTQKDISMINDNKRKALRDKWKIPKRLNENEILPLLQKQDSFYQNFIKDPLIAYFFTLRNLIIHAGFPHIYSNQYDEKNGQQIIKSRKFQHGFVSYLKLESEGFLLTEDGKPLALEGDAESIDEFDYVNNQLDANQKKSLEELLEKTEAKELLIQLYKKMENFVEYFEK